MLNVRMVMQAEINLINKMFAAHSIGARVAKSTTKEVKSSFIAYGLQLARGESIKKIDNIQRELSNELTKQRTKIMRGYSGKAIVRLQDYPLAIEVPHPAPTPLKYDAAPMHMGRFHALIGRSYSGDKPKEEYLDLERHYHALIAARSGGGKSTLMRMALVTLALNTSPKDLQIILIDLKNDDLVPFRALPHVISYAGDIEGAAAEITRVYEIKKERIATQDKPYRLLLVIDELAELGPDKEALKKLGSILSTGRSLGINVWAGTQFPSASAIGSVVAASFTTRIVGIVDGKNTALVATKRAGSGAEKLCTPGDFLRIDDGDMVRMKAYDLSQAASVELIRHVVLYKKKVGMDLGANLGKVGYTQPKTPEYTSENNFDSVPGYDTHFPIKQGRPLNESESQEVRRLAESGQFDYAGELSLRRLTIYVYGSKNPDRMQWIKEALEGVAI